MLIVAFGLFVGLEWDWMIYVAISMLFIGVIYLLAPVENENKLLGELERKVYGKRTRIVVLIEGGLFVLAFIWGYERLIKFLTMSFFIVGISLMAGKIKIYRNSYKQK